MFAPEETTQTFPTLLPLVVSLYYEGAELPREFRNLSGVPSHVYQSMDTPESIFEALRKLEEYSNDCWSIAFRLDDLYNTNRMTEDLPGRIERNRNLMRVRRSQITLLRLWLLDWFELVLNQKNNYEHAELGNAQESAERKSRRPS